MVDCTPRDPSQLLTPEKIAHFFRRRPPSEGPAGPVYNARLFPAPSRPRITSAFWIKYLGLSRPNN